MNKSFPSLDFDLYHRCYQYIHFAETLTRYAAQNSLLTQSTWMLSAWDDMLSLSQKEHVS
ncbi:MAG: hypothetical protein R3B47_19230 [Bacteroidia bacterium]